MTKQLQLKAYLFLENLMMIADDQNEDFGHILREKHLPSLWENLTEEEQELLNNRKPEKFEVSLDSQGKITTTVFLKKNQFAK